MKENHRNENLDYGPNPYVLNVNQAARENPYFRTAVWTGEHLQMTLMNIPVGGEIGWEIHEDTDQMLCIQQGNGMLQVGDSQGRPRYQDTVYGQDVIFIPAGTWHNVTNTGRCPLKISSVYAPPHHLRGTLQEKK